VLSCPSQEGIDLAVGEVYDACPTVAELVDPINDAGTEVER
jgi:hypothetical protein